MSEVRQPRVGDTIIFHEPDSRARAALVTSTWAVPGGPNMVNVVYVSGDEAKHDTYGRQMERATSVHHKTYNPTHGFYWRWSDEDPNPITQPLEN